MALLPNIPTSFVPHAPTERQRFHADFSGVFGFIAYGILAIAFELAIGVFVYGGVLRKTQAAKDTEIAQAEGSIDATTVENFVRLRNRLNIGKRLLDNHIALSNFFDALQTLLPANVRFDSMSVKVDPTGDVKVEAQGGARSFNSLAVLSTSLGKDRRIKDAIFSRLNVNKDGSVSFALTATLDPKLVAFTVANTGGAPSVPATTTTP